MQLRERIRGLACVALALTWIVILLGAVTRLNDAGLGCPDWPGCYGKWRVPAIEKKGEGEPLFTTTHQKKHG